MRFSCTRSETCALYGSSEQDHGYSKVTVIATAMVRGTIRAVNRLAVSTPPLLGPSTVGFSIWHCRASDEAFQNPGAAQNTVSLLFGLPDSMSSLDSPTTCLEGVGRQEANSESFSFAMPVASAPLTGPLKLAN